MVMAKQGNPWRRKLNRLLRQREVNHAGLAELLGVSRDTLRAWLYGKRNPSGTAVKLIDRLLDEGRQN